MAAEIALSFWRKENAHCASAVRLAAFFYAGEGNEPIHIHCRKGDMECKYWLHPEEFEISEAYMYNMSKAAKREIRKIIFDHFEYIEKSWNDFQEKKQA